MLSVPQQEVFVLDPILLSLATVPNLESLQMAGAFVALPTSVPSRSRPRKLPTAVRDKANVMQQLLDNRRIPGNGNTLVSLFLRNLGLTNVAGVAVVRGLILQQQQQQQPDNALKILDLRYNAGVTNVTYNALLEALKGNRILALCSVVLDDNYFHRHANQQQQHEPPDLRGAGGMRNALKEEIDFHTKRLNAVGRAVLFHPSGTCREECVDVLVKARNDLDALYYLLRCRPSAFFG